MKSVSTLIGKIDSLLLRPFSDDELNQRYAEFTNEISRRDDAHEKMAREEYDSIDTKAAAVLQHVSIMIAVSSLLLSQASKCFKWIFGIEAILYVILALCCLRALTSQHLSGNFNNFQDVTAKQALLDLTTKLTFLLSVVLIITVVIELIFR